jgi:hypothetical protein
MGLRRGTESVASYTNPTRERGDTTPIAARRVSATASPAPATLASPLFLSPCSSASLCGGIPFRHLESQALLIRRSVGARHFHREAHCCSRSVGPAFVRRFSRRRTGAVRAIVPTPLRSLSLQIPLASRLWPFRLFCLEPVASSYFRFNTHNVALSPALVANSCGRTAPVPQQIVSVSPSIL